MSTGGDIILYGNAVDDGRPYELVLDVRRIPMEVNDKGEPVKSINPDARSVPQIIGYYIREKIK